jgi:hypothetical protein
MLSGLPDPFFYGKDGCGGDPWGEALRYNS